MPASRSSVLLGVDLGSSGVKAVLLDPERGIVAAATEPVDLFSDHPGWAEADPDQWWRALGALFPRLLGDCGLRAVDVVGVAVTGMVPAIVVLDSLGRPLRRAMLQNDARAFEEIRELRDALSELDLLHISGGILSQQSVAPTALWLSRHEPEVWSRTHAICGSYDWLARQLGAEPHVERNWALESTLFSLDLEPLGAVVDATGIRWPTWLPVRSPGDVVGRVSALAAEQTGLNAGTPIVVGGADHILSAFGAGLIDEGDCLVKLGGAGDVMTVSNAVLFDRRLYLDAHPIPGKWMPNGCMATSGSLLRWEQGLLGGVELAVLDAEAATSEPGALLALPYFLGEKSPIHDPELRGVLIGMHLATTRGDVHRAFLEAIAFGFRRHVEIFEEDGLNIATAYVTNGGSTSRFWREVLADVLHRELTSLVAHPGASFGAAVCAGVGVGAIPDWSFVRGALDVAEVISPNDANAERYDQRYREFIGLTDATAPFTHLIARST